MYSVNDKELIAFDSPAAQHNGIHKLVECKAMLQCVMVRRHSMTPCSLDTAKTMSYRRLPHLIADKTVICNHKARTNSMSCDHEADPDCCIKQMVNAIQQNTYFAQQLQHAK